MKRSGPIKRTTPLRATKSIERGGSLARGGGLSARSPRINARDAVYPERREQVYERARGRCEACDIEPLDGCNRQCEQVHHLAGRGGADPHQLENLMAVSAFHHQWIEEHPEAARALGVMLRRNTDR